MLCKEKELRDLFFPFTTRAVFYEKTTSPVQIKNPPLFAFSTLLLVHPRMERRPWSRWWIQAFRPFTNVDRLSVRNEGSSKFVKNLPATWRNWKKIDVSYFTDRSRLLRFSYKLGLNCSQIKDQASLICGNDERMSMVDRYDSNRIFQMYN